MLWQQTYIYIYTSICQAHSADVAHSADSAELSLNSVLEQIICTISKSNIYMFRCQKIFILSTVK